MPHDAASQSLLSLSLAAAAAQPIHISDTVAANPPRHPPPIGQAPHRRLSSTNRHRRLSDARDAATRPLAVGSPTLAMKGLSLSSSVSPPPAGLAIAASAPADSSSPIPIGSGRNKKRGVDHKCETCSKIYRHPSCLIKHRWEHTPHWRTLSSLPHSASGGVLTKHAQVQLLEAAAILSHLNTDTGTSLPEDRSMWPRWVSGGTLEGDGDVPASYGSTRFGSVASASDYGHGTRTTGSIPGPRLHDYEVPRGVQVRSGVVEVPHPRTGRYGNGHVHGHSVGSAWSVPRSVSVSASVSSEQSRSRSTPSDDEEEDDRAYSYSRGTRVWKHEEEEEFGLEFDLGGVREEEGEEDIDEKGEARRWNGMEDMDDIDMDMD